MPLDHPTQDRVMPGQRAAHPLGKAFPERGAALNVGEQKCTVVEHSDTRSPHSSADWGKLFNVCLGIHSPLLSEGINMLGSLTMEISKLDDSCISNPKSRSIGLDVVLSPVQSALSGFRV